MFYSTFKQFFIFSTLVCLFCLAGCTKQSTITPTDVEMHQSSIITINPNSGLQPIASGKVWAPVTSDIMLKPLGSLAFTLYGPSNTKDFTHFAIISLGTLPRNQWIFAKISSSSAKTETINGRFWVSEVFPVYAQNDWFCQLLRHNGFSVPSVMLAQRWTHSINDSTRVVAEYRQIAGSCVANQPQPAILDSEKADLWLLCRQELGTFATSASVIFSTQEKGLLQPVSNPNFILPEAQPDLAKLIGEAEQRDRERNVKPWP